MIVVVENGLFNICAVVVNVVILLLNVQMLLKLCG